MTDLTFDTTEPLLRTDFAQNTPVARESHEFIVTSPTLPELDLMPAHDHDAIRIPRIVIHAFCDSAETAAAIEKAASDRRMARAHVVVHMGGVSAAFAVYQQAPTPDLVIIESASSKDQFLEELDRLSEVCDAGTRVLALGTVNDISFYRALTHLGISEYFLTPITPVSLILSVASIYGGSGSRKLGKVYAFIGAKGGVGSSTIAHNVAWSISRKLSSSVVLADMDMPFGTASLDFNLDPGQSIAEAISDVSRLDEVLLDRLLQKCDDHLSILSAPNLLERSYDPSDSAIELLIETAQSSVPFLVLDLPHIWTSWAKNVLAEADEIIVTATPDLANLRNAKNLIGVLKQARPHDPPPKLVLNQTGMPKRPEIKPKEFCNAIQVEPVATIPFDANLFGTAANKGKMVADVASRGPAAKAFVQIVDAITGREGTKQRGNRSLYFGSWIKKFNQKPQALKS